MAKMLNATHSWIAFDTSPLVGGAYYKYYLIQAIQAPESLPITAISHIGWVTINGSHRRSKYADHNQLITSERVFLDLNNQIYSPKANRFLTILQAGIMIDSTLTQKLNLNYELMHGFPNLSLNTNVDTRATINGEPGLKALGRY